MDVLARFFLRRTFLGTLVTAFVPLLGCTSPAPPKPPLPDSEPLLPKEPGCKEHPAGPAKEPGKDAEKDAEKTEQAEADEVAASCSIGTCVNSDSEPAVALALYAKDGKKLIFPMPEQAQVQQVIKALERAIAKLWERKA